MKHGKSIRMLCVVLALTIVLGCCAFTAFAEESTLELWAALTADGTDYFTQTGDAAAQVYKESKGEQSNKFIRITAGNSGKQWGSFGLNTDVLATAGQYRVEFDARIPEDYNSDNFYIAAYFPTVSKTLAGSKEALTAIMGEANEWGFRHIVAELDVTESGASVLKFGLNCANGSYIDIDNVAVYKRTSDVSYGTENLAGANCDFEEFMEKGGSKTLTDSWDNYPFRAAADAGTASLVYLTDTSAGVRLNRETTGFASFVKDSVKGYAAGTYTARVTLIADSGFTTDNIGCRINKNGGTLANNISLTGAITADGKTESVLTGTYTVEAYADWTHFNMWCNITTAGKGLTITKIEILNAEGNNIDTLGDLSKISVPSTETLTGLVSKGWAHGYYVPESDFATTSIVKDGDDIVLKMAPSGSGIAFTSVTKSVDTTKILPGKTYAIRLSVKGGANFATNNFGFGLWTNNMGRIESTISYAGISATESVVSGLITIPANAILMGNMDIWLSNNGITDADNYLLVDDIEIVAVSDATFSADLIKGDDETSVGAMEHIEYVQQPTLRETPSVDGLYKAMLFKQGDFETYDEGFTFGEANAYTAYWGSVNLDAPGKVVKDGTNKVAKIAWDGNTNHRYSSMYILTDPDEMATEGAVFELTFSYKLTGNSALANVAFIGASNSSDFCMDLDAVKGAGTYYTSGANMDIYRYYVTESDVEGWFNVRLVFKANIGLKMRSNSVRFLLDTAQNNDNALYIDNVNLALYEAECTHHVDENADAKCDKCNATLECTNHVDANNDGKCDICGKQLPCTEHTDANNDGKCDKCGADMPKEEKKGCFGVVEIGGAALMSVLALAAVVLAAKRPLRRQK